MFANAPAEPNGEERFLSLQSAIADVNSATPNRTEPLIYIDQHQPIILNESLQASAFSVRIL